MPNWRNKISIKEVMSEDTSDEAVLKICQVLIPQLKELLKNENDEKYLKQNKKKPVDEYFTDELREFINDFEYVQRGIETNSEPCEDDPDSWCGTFNMHLNYLYDLGDIIVTKKNGFNDEKFLWID